MGIPKKIPTLVGLLLLALFVGVFIVLFERSASSPAKADSLTSPKNIIVTNVTDKSFTVTWTTDTPTTGALSVTGEGTKSQTVFDERDIAGRKDMMESYRTHSATLRNAEPETIYTFSFLSGGKPFRSADSFTVQTGPQLPGSVSLEPAYGTIRTTDNQPAEGALVYLTIDGSQKLSAVTSTNGTWLIPLNLIRAATLSEYLPTKERMTESLTVVHPDGNASATTDTLNDAPVPQMQIGKTYDFRRQQANAVPGQRQEPTAVLGETTQQTQSTSGFPVTIVKPGQNTAVPSNLPLIQGTGVPGNTVAIALGITSPTGGSAVVGGDGIWRFTPTTALNPGKQSVTITSLDTTGNAVAVTHMFDVLKSGTQVLGEATPSATLAPTVSLTPAPTSTLAGQEIPTSGNMLPVLILAFLSLGLMTTGAFIFVK